MRHIAGYYKFYPCQNKLIRTGHDYNIQERSINHLLYMDDLKLFAKDYNDLEGLVQTVKKFSDDNGISFGLVKCTKATFKRGKLTETTSVGVDRNTVIKDLEKEEVYKYLGFVESNGNQHAAMKEKIRKECYRRVRALYKSHRRNKYFGNTCCIVLIS